MDIKMNAVIVCLMIALAGCATTYQPKSFTGGFSETELGPTSFKIGFAGNGFTSAERASDFAMLRAAEKSIERGCNYFGLMNESDGGSTSAVTVGSAGWGRHGAWGSSVTTPIFKPNSVLLVKCFQSEPAGSELFDAHFISHSIRTKYHMPDTQGAPVPVAPEPQAAVAGPVSAPQVPATNIAQQVLSAQRVSTSQQCGDVSANPDGTFQASCSQGTLIIECVGNSCHPERMKSN